jgi:branched-chain amino acid transport system ATP-binding protein
MLLQLDNVSSGYGDIRILHDISFGVEDGQVLGLLGRNGMGKTTLIKTIAGLLRSTQGSLFFQGRDITKLKTAQRARLGLTTVVQGRGIFGDLTVRENLEMGRIAGGGNKPDRTEEVVEYFPWLPDRYDQRAGTLSGGEQQMLAIARGLMTCPRLMLLDEPSDGVMPLIVDQIGEILLEINRRENMTIIVVEQNVSLIEKMARSCIFLEKGSIVARGSMEELSENESIKEFLAI